MNLYISFHYTNLYLEIWPWTKKLNLDRMLAPEEHMTHTR